MYATADPIDANRFTCAHRVTITETNVIAALVGSFLILAGDGEAMISMPMSIGFASGLRNAACPIAC
ncbi:hypothetical protein [Mesorhizobium amorphae]|uniref:Uncharacterized protein n=1 Tax=Mesorhizobium amorphae CCNWGS0123 TaxID=1082933 RepID=G6YIL2_9HYPH|nr:hypothetical protein [Mesorhizobium amorphae]ANT53005.1 hypothetical protein A6B35_25600 [Mesorhizobium amorphae CCNWGS0123]EHH06229.1 hypothetical protein MEA186_29187 [Mesorhizobium amorphae CCNWGS0123]